MIYRSRCKRSLPFLVTGVFIVLFGIFGLWISSIGPTAQQLAAGEDTSGTWFGIALGSLAFGAVLLIAAAATPKVTKRARELELLPPIESELRYWHVFTQKQNGFTTYKEHAIVVSSSTEVHYGTGFNTIIIDDLVTANGQGKLIPLLNGTPPRMLRKRMKRVSIGEIQALSENDNTIRLFSGSSDETFVVRSQGSTIAAHMASVLLPGVPAAQVVKQSPGLLKKSATREAVWTLYERADVDSVSPRL